MASPDYQDALGYLYGRINYERTSAPPYLSQKLSLERMHELLERLGNPQDGLPIVHIAGTKGKGSTAAMIASILSCSGRSVGLYTSPHLERLEERFVIDGEPCNEEELVDSVHAIRAVVDAMDDEAAARSDGSFGPTFFEITTAIALLHFARRAVDVVVLEVGMGGRLDSTNVCHPIVSVITSISLDHTKQLGDTTAKIAREKAGIIKPGVPVVSGVDEGEPRAAIEDVARSNEAPCFTIDSDFRYKYQPFAGGNFGSRLDYAEDSSGSDHHFSGLTLAVLGRHQARNAAVAVATICRLRDSGWDISESAMRSGLSRAVCPGRIEVVSHDPIVVLDTAHNVASIEALIEAVRESFADTRRTLIFAATKEKDVRGMLERLLPEFDAVVVTRYVNNPRSLDIEEVHRIANDVAGLLSPDQRPSIVCSDSPRLAWEHVQRAAEPSDLICITGSFFLAAELRPLLVGERTSLCVSSQHEA